MGFILYVTAASTNILLYLQMGLFISPEEAHLGLTNPFMNTFTSL